MENAEDWTKEELIKNYVDQMTAVTVQVNISIKGKHTILDATSVEKILRNAEIIALQDCSCRTRWQKCDAPIDVCLTLSDHARDSIEEGARRISLAQALVVLQRSHRAGLVHLALIDKKEEAPFAICSCCSCCCHSLSALVRFGIPEHVVASEYVAQQDCDTCSNCGACVKRCHFRARQLDSEGKLVFNQARCFGCGVCVSTCPTTSITLIKRNNTL